jgi:flagellar protein FlaG
MSVEPITIAVNNLAPPAQSKLPTEIEITQKDKVKVDVKAEEAAAEEEEELEPSMLTELVADVQKNVNMIHSVDLQFSVHEASGEIMVTVMDGSTGDVIREVPPSEILDLAAKLEEMVGIMFDQKA